MSEYYGAEPDNSLPSFVHNSNVWIYGASSSGSWSYASDANTQNTDPTATETMYWNRGDQPFDGTLNGSFEGGGNTGRLFRRYSGSDDGGIYCQGNGRFGDVGGGSDYDYQKSTSGVWCFPWQKITKGPHTFYGNWYSQASSYPSQATTEQKLYMVEYDGWSIDPNDPKRGILSLKKAKTLLWQRGVFANETNWSGQAWSKNLTTKGRYLCLEWQGNTSPNYYTKYYMSCSVS